MNEKKKLDLLFDSSREGRAMANLWEAFGKVVEIKTKNLEYPNPEECSADLIVSMMFDFSTNENEQSSKLFVEAIQFGLTKWYEENQSTRN